MKQRISGLGMCNMIQSPFTSSYLVHSRCLCSGSLSQESDQGSRMVNFCAEMIRRKINKLKNNVSVGCDGQMHYHVEKLSYLDMVLITEDYDRGLVLLAKKLGWPLQTLLYVRRHDSKNSNLTADHLQAIDEFFAYVEQPSERLTESARAWKHDCFEVDGQLYKAANKTYYEQLQNLTQKQSDEVDRHVALLQSANEALADCCSKHPLDVFCSVMYETPYCWNRRTGQWWSPNRPRQQLSMSQEGSSGVAPIACRH